MNSKKSFFHFPGILFIFLLILPLSFKGQDVNINSSSFLYPQLERLEIKSGRLSNGLFLDLKPVSRSDAFKFIDTLSKDTLFQKRMTKGDQWWNKYFRSEFAEHLDSGDHLKNSVFKTFYTYKSSFYAVNRKDFKLFVNPVFYFEQGRSNLSKSVFRNSKGGEIRGSIGYKISFYTYFTDNQVNTPGYIKDFVKMYETLPGEGFIKEKGKWDYDYITARGYIAFRPIKEIRIQFGNDKLFIGDGERSLLFSDFAKDFIHLKINTQVWKFNYQNIFAQFTDKQNLVGLGRVYPPKYGAFHFLSLDVLKNWNVGLFEGVMFGKTGGRPAGYELSYLNPVIFYRSAEQQLGSVDNTMIGANSSLLLFKKLKLYGQIFIDEFKISELRKDRGWAGNKYGLQGGLKYVDIFGLPNVDIQLEGNLVRPYVYASDTTLESFSNWKVPMGHVRGGNLRELTAILRINTYAKWDNKFRINYIQQGLSSALFNAGSNPNDNYKAVFGIHPYGNALLQGDRISILTLEYRTTYMLWHNLLLDAYFIIRKQKCETVSLLNQNEKIFSLGLRYNFIPQTYSF